MKQYGHTSFIRSLSQQEQYAGMKVYSTCLNLQPQESVLIVTDENLKDTEAAIFFESAKQFTDQILMIEIPLGEEHGEEPPPEATQLMEHSDVVLMVTSYSLSHTNARFEACRNGARVISMPTITHEIILRTLAIDYAEIADLSKKIAGFQTAGNRARVTSPNGTDLQLDLTGRMAIADTGFFTNPGDFGNLPAGESFIAPVEGKSNGTIIFDGCFADIALDQPITVTVENGTATDIQGGSAARLLNERLARVGKRGYTIAEFGIGTNKHARLYSPSENKNSQRPVSNTNLLEIEKVYGTCHIALGNNATFGGEVDVPFHSDGVILKPTVTIDENVIVKDGEFTG
jgi:leucyl aminopeptidase (aminopeptidase T)